MDELDLLESHVASNFCRTGYTPPELRGEQIYIDMDGNPQWTHGTSPQDVARTLKRRTWDAEGLLLPIFGDILYHIEHDLPVPLWRPQLHVLVDLTPEWADSRREAFRQGRAWSDVEPCVTVTYGELR